MQLKDLEGERVGICVSGGLDSKTVTTRLLQAGVDVRCFTADLAQPDEADVGDVVRRMQATGATTTLVDLKDSMAEACFAVLGAQATYDGGYWNTTGIARAVTVRGLLGAMREAGCTVLAHGATGRGNDQVRFERYTNVLAPDMKVYAPWRDPALLAEFPGRQQMAAYLRERGIEADVGPRKRYSTDANLAGLSHEAEDLESLETSCLIVDPQMGVWPKDAPDEMRNVRVRIEGGRCVAIDGERVTPLQAMLTANRIGGAHGLGIKSALENRVVGTKSRGVYEAPGMELLGHCLAVVYQATLDRRAADLFRHLSRRIADQIYDGRYYDARGPGRDRRAGGGRHRHGRGRPVQGQPALPEPHRMPRLALQRSGLVDGGERRPQPRQLPGLRRGQRRRGAGDGPRGPDPPALGFGPRRGGVSP
jgi:argininosuccinate synthase